MFVNGIGVPRGRERIDWHAVAKDASGIAFVYVEASEGVRRAAPNFTVNYQGIKAVGIMRGAYHVFRPAAAASDQVQNFLRTIGIRESGDLPPMLDVKQADGMRADVVAKRVTQWLDQIQMALSCTPIIRTSAAFWDCHVGDTALLREFRLWIARGTGESQPGLPDGATSYLIREHGDKGRIDGIDVAVDRVIGPADLLRI